MEKKFARDCDAFHQLPQVQNLIKGGAENYHQHDANYALVCGNNGAPTIPSFVPDSYFIGQSEMSFFQRLRNFGALAYQILTREFIFLPAIEEVYQKHIPDAPSFHEIARNVSLILGAGHPSFGPLRPTMPDLYKVLWKWEVELKASKEYPKCQDFKVPQQDILGHPKCKLFITHGGLSSLHEAIYHGVPVIGIPFFGDQDWNMAQVEYSGIGLKLELSDITDEYFTNILETILNNPGFEREVQKRSTLFRDRQNSPLEKAVWSIEYVLRHGGAPHLRSPARSFNWGKQTGLPKGTKLRVATGKRKVASKLIRKKVMDMDS
ncbi:UDP-glucuronosyltransferase 2C1 [Orchesella cincta]|uniref:UDP-glucuronosyltransferase 2C1 n=1 Tax=Orchesella cincta TaxID=48709 RepID=A0A1D2MTN6_ORCCI|nr:UDP-glucuronosyltransferase 2C1 [Orchesella cincta]